MLTSRILSGRRALITGAAGGIGSSMLEAFASAGADLIVCVRESNENIQARCEFISKTYSVDVRLLSFDLLNDDEIKDAMKSLFIDKVRVDILVNNAGFASGGFLSMTSLETLRNTFQINFFAAVHITQIVSKWMMKQRNGVILNIGSIAGLDNFPGYTAYGSSKAALMQFTQILSSELAPYAVRVNAIAPALTETNMASQMEVKAFDAMVERSAMKRLGRPNEIANLAVFLASDQASFVNGQVIRADGGM